MHRAAPVPLTETRDGSPPPHPDQVPDADGAPRSLPARLRDLVLSLLWW